MNIGIVCYASVGGSGVVATELAHALAERGHDIHLISSELPFRWRDGVPGLSFERVQVPPYPLFREPQYLLALTNTIVRVARERAARHRPRPLRGAARDGGVSRPPDARRLDRGRTPRTVTTLHGTDITLVGSDPSYRARRRVLDRAVARRDGGVREPARDTHRGARRARATSP